MYKTKLYYACILLLCILSSMLERKALLQELHCGLEGLELFLVMVTCVSFSSLSEGACTILGDTTSLVMGLTTRAEVVVYWLEYLDMLVLCFLRCFRRVR